MKVLIVDDEPLARERLKKQLSGIAGVSIAGEAGDGRDALEKVEALQPDVVLLDVRMPGMDGLEAGRYLSAMPQPPAIIFTTAYGEHALDAFQTHAVDYLLKPVRQEKLAHALQAAKKLSRVQVQGVDNAWQGEGDKARSHICARSRGNLKLVPVEDVFYFKADSKYVVVRYADGEILIEESLKALEDEFGERFMRVHRNALVAVHRLNGLDKGSDGHCRLRFQDIDDLIEVSRRHLSQVRKVFRD